MKIAQDITELIGNTPMLELNRLTAKYGLNAVVTAKLELMNPAGSVKDRIALKMILDAERDGKLKAGDIIVEPTSGNTGIGLAMVGALRGYKVVLTMPESMSVERRQMLAAYGAELVLTPAARGMDGAVERAKELVKEHNAWLAGQFDNPSNPLVHYETTAEEILRDTDGELAAFVAGVGSGGTVSGTARRLKESVRDLHTVAVEPTSSPLLSGGKAGGHKIQGIGANFIPDNFDSDYVDEVMSVTDEQAYDMCRELASVEGLLVGISGGAAVAAAIRLASRGEFCNKRIVVIIPDGGMKYLSAGVWQV